MTFLLYQKARNVARPDLTGQVVGLCVVEGKAPAVTSSQRWRIRCRAMVQDPNRDECGVVFYLTTVEVHRYQTEGNELFCCPSCRKLRRAAQKPLVRFHCSTCGGFVEMQRKQHNKRPESSKRLCKGCAIGAGRLKAARGKIGGLVKANAVLRAGAR